MQQVPLQATLALVSTEKVLVHSRTKVKFEGSCTSTSPRPLSQPWESGSMRKSGRVFLCENACSICSVQNESLTKSFDAIKESLAGLVFTPRPLSACSLGDYCTVDVII